MAHKIYNLPDTTPTRRRLRKDFTPQERILWSKIRDTQLGFKFRREHGIGNYVVDFYCAGKQLVVEVDGSQHFQPEGIAADAKRTAFLESKGCRVLRFPNSDINTNIAGVVDIICNSLNER